MVRFEDVKRVAGLHFGSLREKSLFKISGDASDYVYAADRLNAPEELRSLDNRSVDHINDAHR
jgi:hypothetical protein